MSDTLTRKDLKKFYDSGIEIIKYVKELVNGDFEADHSNPKSIELATIRNCLLVEMMQFQHSVDFMKHILDSGIDPETASQEEMATAFGNANVAMFENSTYAKDPRLAAAFAKEYLRKD